MGANAARISREADVEQHHGVDPSTRPRDADKVGSDSVIGAVATNIEINEAIQPERSKLHIGVWTDIASQYRLNNALRLLDGGKGFLCAGQGTATRRQLGNVLSHRCF